MPQTINQSEDNDSVNDIASRRSVIDNVIDSVTDSVTGIASRHTLFDQSKRSVLHTN